MICKQYYNQLFKLHKVENLTFFLDVSEDLSCFSRYLEAERIESSSTSELGKATPQETSKV